MTADDSKRLPAEWEPHRATWLAWPHCRSDWPGKFPCIPWIYTELIRHLLRSEDVELVCGDVAQETEAKHHLAQVGVLHELDGNKLRFHQIPTDRSWLRDSAPTSVVTPGGLRWIGWSFNAWTRYDDFRNDEQVAQQIANLTQQPFIEARRDDVDRPFHLEGGAFDGNGTGTLLVTEQCLLSSTQSRNPGLTQQAYEAMFAKYLGTEKTIWLGEGCSGDDTNGHIDDIARFVSPDTVVAVLPQARSHPDFLACEHNLDVLRGATNAEGQRLNVVELPMPDPVIFNQQMLPASYANFYVANRVVIVPVFGDPLDRTALGILSELFPSRQVVGIYARDFVLGLGTFHCSTQQEPAVCENANPAIDS